MPHVGRQLYFKISTVKIQLVVHNINSYGMTMKYIGACHCNAVRFAFDADINEVVSCNCTLCSKRAALMLSVQMESFDVTGGREGMREYRWNTGTARHYFCGQCGIYIFHQRRSDPSMLSVNANCVIGLDIQGLPVRHVDGKSRSEAQQAN